MSDDDVKSTISDYSNCAELREKPVGGDKGGYKDRLEMGLLMILDHYQAIPSSYAYRTAYEALYFVQPTQEVGAGERLREECLQQLYRRFDFGTQGCPYIDYGHKKDENPQ